MHIERQQIVDYARALIGIPYRHQGRSMRGVDCVGPLILITKHFGLTNYKEKFRRYTQNPEKFNLIPTLDSVLIPIKKEEINIADILLFYIIRGIPQHIAIISNFRNGGLGIIHTYQTLGKVAEHRLNRFWRDKIVKQYTIPEVF